ncbi:PqiC family protein [Citrifermentans bremense]|uniref:PqiC family protein n=1 Tax=Citrifermentans bremense TaxID=60035 RepID=UPI0003FEFB92|nr:PqiC family protein [Citrifermentans bremense]
MRKPALCLISLALVMSVTACSRSPRSSFYTLVPQAAPPALSPAAPSVSVGPVTIPELVDRPQIVVRVAENRVEVLESHRWAEPLKSEIPRLMAQDLGRMLGSSRVSSYGQSAGADATYRVLVDIVRLEAVPGDTATVQALWTVRRGNARIKGESLVREKVSAPSYDQLISACSRALAGVSSDIAKAIRADAAALP